MGQLLFVDLKDVLLAINNDPMCKHMFRGYEIVHHSFDEEKLQQFKKIVRGSLVKAAT